jgi:hypothetical protein
MHQRDLIEHPYRRMGLPLHQPGEFLDRVAGPALRLPGSGSGQLQGEAFVRPRGGLGRTLSLGDKLKAPAHHPTQSQHGPGALQCSSHKEVMVFHLP